MSDHTPGPWLSNQYGEVWGGGEIVAEVHGDTPEDWQADARLIAAAPDLLEACEIAERAFRVGDNPDAEIGALVIMRAAIAKAKGRE